MSLFSATGADAPSSSVGPENFTQAQPFTPAQAAQLMGGTYSIPSSCDKPMPQVAPHICNVCGYPPPPYRKSTERNVPCKQCGYVGIPNEPQIQRAVPLQEPQMVRNTGAPVHQGPPLPSTNVPAPIFQPIGQSTPIAKPRLPVQHDGHGFEMSQVSSIGVPRGQSEPTEHCMRCCFQSNAQGQQGGLFPPMQGVQQMPQPNVMQTAAPAHPPITYPGEPHKWHPEMCQRCCSARVTDPAVVPGRPVVSNVPPTTPVSYRFLDSLESVTLGGNVGGGGGGEREGRGVGGGAATEFFLLDETSGKAERWNLAPAAKYSFMPAQGADGTNLPPSSPVAPAQAKQVAQSVQRPPGSGTARAVSGLTESKARSPSRYAPLYTQSELSQVGSSEPSGYGPLYTQSELSQIGSSEPSESRYTSDPSDFVELEPVLRETLEPDPSRKKQLRASQVTGGSYALQDQLPQRESVESDSFDDSQLESEESSEIPFSPVAQLAAALQNQVPALTRDFQSESPRAQDELRERLAALTEHRDKLMKAYLLSKAANAHSLQSESSDTSPVSVIVIQGSGAGKGKTSHGATSPGTSGRSGSPTSAAQTTRNGRPSRRTSSQVGQPLYTSTPIEQQRGRLAPQDARLYATQEGTYDSSGNVTSELSRLRQAMQSDEDFDIPDTTNDEGPYVSFGGVGRMGEDVTNEEDFISRCGTIDTTRDASFKIGELMHEKVLEESLDLSLPGTSDVRSPDSTRTEESFNETGSSYQGTPDSTRDTSAGVRRLTGDVTQSPAATTGITSQGESQRMSQRGSSESASTKSTKLSRSRWSPSRIFRSSASSKGSSSGGSSAPRESAPAQLQRQSQEDETTASGRQAARPASAPARPHGTQEEDFESPEITDYDLRGDFSAELARFKRDALSSSKGSSSGASSAPRESAPAQLQRLSQEDEQLSAATTTGRQKARPVSAPARPRRPRKEDFEITDYDLRGNFSAEFARLKSDALSSDEDLDTTGTSYYDTSVSMAKTQSGVGRLYDDIITEEGVDASGLSYHGTPESAWNTSAGVRRLTRDVIPQEESNVTGPSYLSTPDSSYDSTLESAKRTSGGVSRLTRDVRFSSPPAAAQEQDLLSMTTPTSRPKGSRGPAEGSPDRSPSPAAVKGTTSRPASAPRESAGEQSQRLSMSVSTQTGRQTGSPTSAAARSPRRSSADDYTFDTSYSDSYMSENLSPVKTLRSPSPGAVKGTPSRPTSSPRQSPAAQSQRLSQADASLAMSTKSGRRTASPTVGAAHMHRSPSPGAVKGTTSRPTSSPRRSSAAQSQRLSQADASLAMSTKSGRRTGSPTAGAAYMHSTSSDYSTDESNGYVFTSENFSPLKTLRSPSPRAVKGPTSRPTSPPRQSPAAQSQRLSLADESTQTGRQTGSPASAASRSHRSSEDEVDPSFSRPIRRGSDPGELTSPQLRRYILDIIKENEDSSTALNDDGTDIVSSAVKKVIRDMYQDDDKEVDSSICSNDECRGLTSQRVHRVFDYMGTEYDPTPTRYSCDDDAIYEKAILRKMHAGEFDGVPEDVNTTGRSSGASYSSENKSSAERSLTTDEMPQDESLQSLIRRIRRGSDPAGITTPQLRRYILDVLNARGKFSTALNRRGSDDGTDYLSYAIKKTILDIMNEEGYEELDPASCSNNECRGLTSKRVKRVHDDMGTEEDIIPSRYSCDDDFVADKTMLRRIRARQLDNAGFNPETTGRRSEGASYSTGNTSAAQRGLTSDSVADSDLDTSGRSSGGASNFTGNKSSGQRRLTNESTADSDLDTIGGCGCGPSNSTGNNSSGQRRRPSESIPQEDLDASHEYVKYMPKYDRSGNLSAELDKIMEDVMSFDDLDSSGEK